MTLITAVFEVVLFFVFPVRRQKLAAITMTIEPSYRGNRFSALLRVEGASELKVDGRFFGEMEGLRATEGALIGVLADAVHALIAEGLSAGSLTDIGLFCDVVADDALELFVLFCLFDVVLRFKGFHNR